MRSFLSSSVFGSERREKEKSHVTSLRLTDLPTSLLFTSLQLTVLAFIATGLRAVFVKLLLT